MAGATGIAALAGCGSSDTTTEDGSGNRDTGDTSGGSDDGTTVGDTGSVTTIEFWRWPHSTDPSNTGEDEIVRAFNEGPGAEQGIRVAQTKNPFGDHRTKLRTSIGGNDAPDVAWTFTERIYDPSGKDRSTIEEEAPFVYIDEYVDDEWLDDFYGPFVDVQRQRFGGVVGAPFIGGINPGIMYLNVDAWNEAGLGEVPTDGWSYEEYLDAVEQMHGLDMSGTTVSGVGVALKDAVSNGEWINYVGGNGLSRTAGSLVGEGYENTDGDMVMTLASSPEVEAWDSMVGTPLENGWTNNPLAYEWLEVKSAFANGELATLHHTPYARVSIGQNADFNWEIVPHPTRNGDSNIATYTAGPTPIITFTAFKEEVGANPEAAAEFIKFRNNARNQYEWFNTSSQTVPNEGAFELMQEEGVSDFVETTGGLQIQSLMDDALKTYSDENTAVTERYPDIATTSTGVPQTGLPRQIASGRVHDTIGGMLQQLANSQNSNVQQRFTNAEEQWASLLQQADDLSVDQESIGWNAPEPQAGPL